MVCWEDAKAVFVAIDEHETGWMAQADLGAALQRAGVDCSAAEVETCLAKLEATQEEAGFLSVDEFCQLCCDWNPASAGHPSEAAGADAAGADAAGADAAGADAAGETASTAQPTAREAELLAALDAARAENAGLRRRLELGGGTAPAPAARAGAAGGIYDPSWTALVRPLYDEHMGVENMGPLLYSLIRFVKPRTILEVGAGYTTLFVLQALKDNEAELSHLRAEKSLNAAAVAANESGGDPSGHAEVEAEAEAGFYVEEALGISGGDSESESAGTSVLHCVDNQEHDVFTAHGGLGAVISIAEELGLEHLLQVHTADAFELLLGPPAEQVAGSAAGGGAEAPAVSAGNTVAAAMPSEWDMVWLDGITTDPRWPAYFEAIWPQLVDTGGLALVHSTLTNATNRQWLRELTMPPQAEQAEESDDPADGQSGGVVGTATFSFRPSAPCTETEVQELAAAIRAIEIAAAVNGNGPKGAKPEPEPEPEPELQRMVWQDHAPTIKPLGFGLSTIDLRAVLTARLPAKTVDAAASLVAERLEGLLQSKGIQGVEVADVVAGTAGGGGRSGGCDSDRPKFEDLFHFGLLEPHKRFQNSVSIFQKRRSDYTEYTPLYSWTP